MKTKAEKYAEGYRCPATNEMEYCRHDIISAYNNGYTQCQEDMVGKKYTEEDMVLCWNASRDYTIQVREFKGTSKYLDREDFINSLNKQY